MQARYGTVLIAYASSIWNSLDRLCKLDMEQHCKWIVHGLGADGLGGKGCTRMRPGPEVARGTGSAGRSRARFPSHWLHGIVRHLEGSVCCF